MVIKLLISHPARGEEYTRLFHQKEVLVGRDEAADLCLDSPAVSLIHLSLTRQGEWIWAQDRGSTNGTSLAGAALPPGERVRLTGQDTVELGPFQITLLEVPPVAHEEEPARGRPSPPTLALVALMAAVILACLGLVAWLILPG